SQRVVELKEKMDFIFAIIESRGIENGLRAKQEVIDHYRSNIAPGLKKLPPVSNKSNTQNIPTQYQLLQNYPNPFNPGTMIGYALPEKKYVEIIVYNLKGELITRLVNAYKEAGFHFVTWNGCNERGIRVSSGIYYYQIKTDNFQISKKMIFFH
ncbi:MAG: T9SS type A sorting domain-containing protein, partial [bacterium]|nr:T9SS type A sorting domain-containing protein [bacterium]